MGIIPHGVNIFIFGVEIKWWKTVKSFHHVEDGHYAALAVCLFKLINGIFVQFVECQDLKNMKRRILSDTFITRQIEKIDKIYESCMGNNLIVTPKCLMPDTDSIFGHVKLTESERKEIRTYYKQLQDLSYVRGFWMGWSTRDGTNEEK